MSSIGRTVGLLIEQMEAGLHVGYQLNVWREGREAGSEAGGVAGEDGGALTDETLMLWMSAGKPVTAVAIAQLWERGLLSLDDPVVKFIPEFAVHNKSAITLRHCLTHTAGFRGPINNFTGGSYAAIVQRVCDLRPEPDWTPGKKAGYHAASSWFILGEIVQRVSGVAFSDYVRDRVFLPCNMPDCFIGMSESAYRDLSPRLAQLPTMTDGVANFDTPANSPESTIIPRPGANARGPMSQLARFYQALLHPGESGVLSPTTAEAITCPHRVGMLDLSFQHKIDWALGFYVNSNHYHVPTTPYSYGPHASARTFGHSGNQSSVAFADPENELVVALAFNGLPGEPAHQTRVRDVLTTLYEELGLAG